MTSELHPVSWHPHGEAILDFLYGREEDPRLIVHTIDGDVTPFPISIYFRDYEDFSNIDELGLSACQGRTLDIGAGAGALTLFLQAMGLEATGIDIAAGAVEAMQEMGVEDARQTDFFSFSGEKYDTLLCMMNGIGFVDSPEGFKKFLKHAETLLNPGGQVIMDSSDLRKSEDMEDLRSAPEDYFGRVWFQMEYKGQKAEPYHWLYLDPEMMAELCAECGWESEVLIEAAEGAYLARLTPAE